MKILKKCFAFLLAMIIIFGVSPANYLFGSRGIFDIHAHAVYSEGIYYYQKYSNSDYAEITGLNQYVAGAIVVPSTLGGYPVIKIPMSLFYNQLDITSVTVQAGITEIADEAFRGCTGLKSVSLPTGLLTIGNNEFYGCSALESIVIPDSVTSLGYGGFYNCVKLTDAVIGDGIVDLGSSLFLKCSSLKNVDLPANLKSIGYGVFDGCSVLKNISIPTSLKTIGDLAFLECTSLESIALPYGLLTLGKWVFMRDTSLVSAPLPDTLTSIGDSVFSGCSNLTAATISSGLTEIPDSMFENCYKLASVSIPDTITKIGNAAFSWCFALADLNWPSNLSSIGSNAFWFCNFTRLTLPEGLLTIGMNAFKQCGNLKIASVPSTVTALPDRMFQSCGNLLSLTVPNSVVNFGTDVFTECPNLKIYGNPGAVIETYANAKGIPYIYRVSYLITFNGGGGSGGISGFQYCGTALTAPAVTRTGYTFTGWLPAVPFVTPTADTTYTAQWTVNKYTITFKYGSAVTTYNLNYGDPVPAQPVPFHPDDLNIFTGWSPTVPATVPAQDTTYTALYTPVYTYTVSGGEATITDCSSLVTGALNIPAVLDGYPVKIIGYNSFKDCIGITAVTIPGSVTFIDVRAFDGCTGLTAITIPSSVTSIGNGSFQNCTTLAEINLPESLTDIGGTAFFNTAWLNAKPDGLVYLGKIFYKYKGTMPVDTTVEIISGTLGIAGGAFTSCSGLVKITLPTSITTIGSRAFYNCTGLTSITIPERVGMIGADCFKNCSNLTVYCYPNSYTEEYAIVNSLNYILVITVSFSLNGGTGRLPFTQTAHTGTIVTLPAQGNITRQYYTFLGWALTATATIPLESYTMQTANAKLYAVWRRVPVSLNALAGASTVINDNEHFIYGLAPAITQASFESGFVGIAGNGRLEYTLPGSEAFGTGTEVRLIDNVTGLVLKTYKIVIFGDVNGDGNVDSMDAGTMVDVENNMAHWDVLTDAVLYKAGNLNDGITVDSIDAGIVVDVENGMRTINQSTGLA